MNGNPTNIIIERVLIKVFETVIFGTLLFFSDWGTPDRQTYDVQSGKPKFENRIKPRMYVRRITRSNMYEKVPFC